MVGLCCHFSEGQTPTGALDMELYSQQLVELILPLGAL